jgi:hypothetical protein
MQYVTCLSIPSNKKPKHKKRHWAGERERERERGRGREGGCAVWKNWCIIYCLFHLLSLFTFSLSETSYTNTEEKINNNKKKKPLLPPPPPLSPLFFSGPLLYSSLSHFLSFFLFNSFCFFFKKNLSLNINRETALNFDQCDYQFLTLFSLHSLSVL